LLTITKDRCKLVESRTHLEIPEIRSSMSGGAPLSSLCDDGDRDSAGHATFSTLS
jgi:hypothetical protein